HALEPVKVVLPFLRVMLELLQGLADQAFVARDVLADEALAAAGRRGGVPAQRIGLVIAHDAGGLAGLDHVVDQLQRLADARATVDDVAEEQRHAPRMTPDPAMQPIAELLEQSLQGSRATMDITDQ